MLVALFRTLRLGLFAPLAVFLFLAACDSVEERIEKHYQQGQALLEDGQTQKAILEFRNALKLNKDHAPSHFAMGQIAESRGELQAAFGRFKKVVEIEPQNAAARIKVARFYLLGGGLDEAGREVAELLKLDPTRAEVQVLAASLALRQGDLPAARAALDTAQSLDPGNVELALVEISYLMKSATPAAALTRADEALDAHPENQGLHIVKVQLLEQIGDQAGLGAQLSRMIEIFPDQKNFREARVRWAIRAGDNTIAEQDLRALVEADPGAREPVMNLIRFLRQKEGDTAARAALAALAKREDSTLELELLLAQFDVETGHKDEAIAYLRTLVDRKDSDANEARVALTRLLISEGKIEEADALIAEILAEDPKNVDGLVFSIARQIDNEELEPAVQQVRTALNEAPNDTRLLLLAGRAQELQGNLDLANDRLAKAVRVDGYKAETVARYVQFLIRTNRVTAAETVLAEALSKNQGSEGLLDLLASTRLRLENWAGAEQAAWALEQINPDRARQIRAAILIGQERFDEGASLLRESMPEDTRQRAASVSALVQTYIRDGKTAEAEAFLDELLAENPENLQALGVRGNLYAIAGDYAAAEEKYRAILAIDPGNGGAHSALARLLARQGDEAAAEAQLEAGLQISPDNLLLLARLAETRERQGDFDGAIELYDRLYGIIPNSLLIANNLSTMLADHRADDPEAVDRAYRIANRLETSDVPQYRDTYGWTRYLKGEYQEALERLEPVAEALPNNPWVHYHLGLTYAALQQPAKARASLEAALAISTPEMFPPTADIKARLAEMGSN